MPSTHKPQEAILLVLFLQLFKDYGINKTTKNRTLDPKGLERYIIKVRARDARYTHISERSTSIS